LNQIFYCYRETPVVVIQGDDESDSRKEFVFGSAILSVLFIIFYTLWRCYRSRHRWTVAFKVLIKWKDGDVDASIATVPKAGPAASSIGLSDL
ncbi:hypothetical protein Bhyg_17361, partial [Pseudolycoriella hygida]